MRSPSGSPTTHGCSLLFETPVITQEGAGPRAGGMSGAAQQSCHWQEILLQGKQHYQTQTHANAGFP